MLDTQVRNGLIQFARTKPGKTRAVPIIDDLDKAIHAQIAPSHLEAAKTLNPISVLTLG